MSAIKRQVFLSQLVDLGYDVNMKARNATRIRVDGFKQRYQLQDSDIYTREILKDNEWKIIKMGSTSETIGLEIA